MKRLAGVLIRLYPFNWRQRYGEEFEALLEDHPATLRTVFDLLKGALKMHLNVPAFSRLAAALSTAGLLAGLAVSFFCSPRYVSTAELSYRPAFLSRDFTPNLMEEFMRFKGSILSRTSLSMIIQDPRLNLYESERARLPLEDVIDKMRNEDIHIEIDPANSVPGQFLTFRIRFVSDDPVKARDTVQTLIVKFMDANLTQARAIQIAGSASTEDEVSRLEQRLAAIEKHLGIVSPAQPAAPPAPLVQRTGLNLDVIDPPTLPAKPVSPNRAVFMLGGLGAGFASALLIALFQRRLPAIPYPAQSV